MSNLPKERITLNDSVKSAILKLTERNPGALSVCLLLYEHSSKVDPDCFYGDGIGQLLSLDSNRIYADKIWMLYRYVCKGNIAHAIAMLRGCQLGFISSQELHSLINRQQIEGKAVSDIVKMVSKRLPNFNADFKIEEVDNGIRAGRRQVNRQKEGKESQNA